MPVLNITDGMVPTSTQINANWRDQVVSTVTSATRPSGTQGQIIYETDTGLLYIYHGGWVRFGASGVWTTYTPTITQSAVITKTVTYSKYEKIGRKVTWNAFLSLTSAGVANNPVNVTLPFTAAAANLTVGVGDINDNGIGIYPCIVNLGSTTAVQFFGTDGLVTAAMGQSGAGFSAALASGDTIRIGITYETAS